MKIGIFTIIGRGPGARLQNYALQEFLKKTFNADVKTIKSCLLYTSVKIYDNNHRFNNFNMNIKEQGFSIGEIKIGKNCWLANNVIVLKGAEIGDNVVIGAGCIIKEKIQMCIRDR